MLGDFAPENLQFGQFSVISGHFQGIFGIFDIFKNDQNSQFLAEKWPKNSKMIKNEKSRDVALSS